jgi:hypothetical protein
MDQYSREDVARVVRALDISSVVEGTKPGATDAQNAMLKWLGDTNCSLDEFIEGRSEHPVLATLMHDDHGHELRSVCHTITDRLRDRVHEECGDDATDFLKRFLSLYATIYGKANVQYELECLGEEFAHKVPPERRQELVDHARSVVDAMGDDDDHRSEYVKEFVGLDEEMAPAR